MADNILMGNWPNRRLLDLLKLEIPIIQAPMAGSDSVALARSVSSTGALGSLACALLTPNGVRESARAIRDGMSRPFNLNFFCHTMEAPDVAAKERWKSFLRSHYERLGLDIEAVAESRLRLPFNEEMCDVVEEVNPAVVSFHFGLPTPDLMARLKKRGIGVLSSATSVEEAKWLEERGCDAVIVQGFEAGGHRAMFLETNAAAQVGLFALLPQVVDAVSIPVVAAGGVADARGIVAAFALGASGVQMGTAYLFCPEANVSPAYRRALEQGGRHWDSRDQSIQRPPRQRHSEPVSQRRWTYVRSRVGLPIRSDTDGAFASGFGEGRFTRLHAAVGWPGGSTGDRHARRSIHPKACRGRA